MTCVVAKIMYYVVQHNAACFVKIYSSVKVLYSINIIMQNCKMTRLDKTSDKMSSSSFPVTTHVHRVDFKGGGGNPK
jgi:hypothetical protein